MRALRLVAVCLVFAACGEGEDEFDDDVDETVDEAGGGGGGSGTSATPHTFTLHIENIAPWRNLKAGVVETKNTGAIGPLAPNETYSVTFSAGKGQTLSFATMFGESNDWFLGTRPEGLALFDEQGVARSGDVTGDVHLWDAGTEFDEEPFVGASTGSQQSEVNVGALDPQTGIHLLRSTTIVLDTGGNFLVPRVNDMIKVTLTPVGDHIFTLTIQNCSSSATLQTSLGARPIHLSPVVWTVSSLPNALFATTTTATPGFEHQVEDAQPDELFTELAYQTGAYTDLSPGVFVIHRDPAPLFGLGEADRGQGLEQLAENGNPAQLAAIATGVFNIPTGAEAVAAAHPGQAYDVQFQASPGDRLSLATMFGMSNDWFFATAPEGIALFDGGRPRDVDISQDIGIYDAGTEEDQELAIGTTTGPQQGSRGGGPADPNASVRLVSDSIYARRASDHMVVTITP